MNTGESMNAIISLAIDDWLSAHPATLEVLIKTESTYELDSVQLDKHSGAPIVLLSVRTLPVLTFGTGCTAQYSVSISLTNRVLEATLMSSQSDQSQEVKEASLFDQIFRDSDGNIVIAQPPNLPVIVGVTAAILQSVLPNGQLQVAAKLIAFGALFTWAWQELFDGVNYFRRGLGLIGLGGLMLLGLNFLSMWLSI